MNRPAGSPLAGRSARRRLVRNTLRLRLTVVYGGLFLLSGTALLIITYLLVRNAIGTVYVKGSSHGGSVSGAIISNPHGSLPVGGGVVVGHRGATTGPRFTARQLQAQTRQLQLQAAEQRATELHQLIVDSVIALAIMAVISIALGWLVAGRVLRPLRAITATARRITATNLHQRLRLGGQNDELKELGDTFDDLLERLDASFRSQRQFVANASHELRTPLARQRTLIQVALADPDANTETLRTTSQRVLAAGREQEQLLEGSSHSVAGTCGPGTTGAGRPGGHHPPGDPFVPRRGPSAIRASSLGVLAGSHHRGPTSH